MAQDAVDAIAPETRSRTLDLPLHGAEGFREAWDNRGFVASRLGLTPRGAAALLKRHGSAVTEIADAVADRPELATVIAGTNYIAAEVVHAVTHEGARTLDDIVTRRLRIRMESRDVLQRVLGEFAALAGESLGWSAAERKRQIADVTKSLEAERAAETANDDHTADAIRTGALR
jgi:glycerol-3-phosphate dehydrogenase